MGWERKELELAYDDLVKSQNGNDQEKKLRAAMRVIVAWERVSHEVTEQCQGAIDKILDKTT